MTNYHLILASNSPRRKELLEGLDLPFTVKVKKYVPEDYPKDLPVAQVPQFIAKEKASAYDVCQGELLLTADTVVVVGQEVLGKPVDESDARRMLRLLSGRTHQVITGVCLTTTSQQKAFSVSTNVTFKELSDDEINYYISKYQPFDKAGAYGIQEWIGYVGVTKLEGSYYNVMGLPVQRIYEEMQTM